MRCSSGRRAGIMRETDFLHESGEPEGDPGEGNKKKNGDDKRQEKGKNSPEYGLKRHVSRDAADNIYIDSHGRRYYAYLRYQNNDNAEPYGIVLKRHDNGIKNRNREHNKGQGVNKAPSYKVDHENQHDNSPWW